MLVFALGSGVRPVPEDFSTKNLSTTGPQRKEKKRSDVLNAGKRIAQVRETTLLDNTSHSPSF